jgi:RHS repeat-associated protein
MQGAGGVGGLLVIENPNGPDYFPVYDGNGNVVGLLDNMAYNLAVTYEYEPFGKVVKETGEASKANGVRFSTKYQDSESGLNYYGYRYLEKAGWISRDPLGEKGSRNVYAFVLNDAVDYWDRLGLDRGGHLPDRPVPPAGPDDSQVPPGECRIQVCCGSVLGSVYQHCYTRFNDDDGVSGCRGGHSLAALGTVGGSSGSSTAQTPPGCRGCCGFYGTIVTTCDPTDPALTGDLTGSNQTCQTVAQGPMACAARDCIRARITQFQNGCYRYSVSGPNSNTAIASALQDCLGGASQPAGVLAPGFRPIGGNDEICR